MFRDNLSALNDMIGGNRLSRQRIGKIMGTASCEQQTEVTRFDLILLNFLIWSYKTDEYPTKNVFFDAFYEDTNKMLVDCFMHPLIIQNPLENMILVCMISEDPLDTFESIWEQSYNTEDLN